MHFEQLQRPISTKVTACEETTEAWKLDHENARLLYDFEDLLGDVIECYDNIQRLDKWFADKVATSPELYSEDVDRSIVDLCRRVHQLAERISSQLLPYFGAKYDVSLIDEFRNRLARARQSEAFGYRKDATESNQSLATTICESLGL